MLGPDTAWYIAVAGVLFGIGTTGVILRRSPLMNVANMVFPQPIEHVPDAARLPQQPANLWHLGRRY